MTHDHSLGPWRGAVVVALVLGVAGCTSGGEPVPYLDWDTVLAEARAGGASREQMAVLDGRTVPSLEEYEAAIGRSLACVRAAGHQTNGPHWFAERGIPFARYGLNQGTGEPDEQQDAVVEECFSRHSRWIERAWVNQPWEDADEQRRIEELRPALVACLERGGLQTDPDESLIELLDRAENWAGGYGIIDEGAYVDCAAEVGV